MSTLEEMIAEVERLRAKYGEAPVRLEVGVACWLALEKVAEPTRAEESVVASKFFPEQRHLNGIPVRLRLDWLADEWAPVYRAPRLSEGISARTSEALDPLKWHFGPGTFIR